MSENKSKQFNFYMIYSETCLNRTLYKPKSCIHQTLDKVQIREIFYLFQTQNLVPGNFSLDRFHCNIKKTWAFTFKYINTNHKVRPSMYSLMFIVCYSINLTVPPTKPAKIISKIVSGTSKHFVSYYFSLRISYYSDTDYELFHTHFRVLCSLKILL